MVVGGMVLLLQPWASTVASMAVQVFAADMRPGLVEPLAIGVESELFTEGAG